MPGSTVVYKQYSEDHRNAFEKLLQRNEREVQWQKTVNKS